MPHNSRIINNTLYNNRMQPPQSRLLNFAIIFVMLFAFFFGYLDTSIKYVVLAVAALMFFILTLRKLRSSLSFRIEDFFFLAFLLVGILSLLQTNNLSRAIVYLCIWCFGLLIKVWLPFFSYSAVFIAKCLFAFSSVHVSATLLQIIKPELMTAINVRILPVNSFYWNTRFLRISAFTGITAQTGTNAFYIALFIGVVTGKMLVLEKGRYSKRLAYLAMLAAAFFALISTQKRGPTLFSVISIIALSFIWAAKVRGNYLRFTAGFVFLGAAVCVALFFTPLGKTLLQRFLYSSSGDISTGRFEMFVLMWQNTAAKPFLGHGVASAGVLVSGLGHTLGHNIYLQCLYDTGLLGLALLLCFMVFTVTKTIKLLIATHVENQSTIKSYLCLVSLYIQLFFITYGFTGNPLYDHFQFIIYMVACALPGMAVENRY